MSNTDRMSLLERWAIGMETLEQYYECKYGPPATPAQLPAITTYDGMLEAIADGLQRAKRNVNKKSSTYHSDSVAYVKTVPAGDVHYASLERIGGKTVVMNNQAVMPTPTTWTGLTFTANADGSKTMNGTAEWTSGTSKNTAQSYTLKANHKYIFKGCPAGGGADKYYFGYAGYVQDIGEGYYHSQGGSDLATTLRFYIYGGEQFTNARLELQVTDLTVMFGAGNEPSTIAEFEAICPSYIAYNPGSLLSAGVTEVVSQKADTTTLETYSVPAEVRALSGYGWSCPSHYNYIDFEAKKFVQEVGSRAYASGDESDSTVITDSTTTYYPLNPAIETDISAYLTDDNLISVESGGALTFPNSNGDNYRIPVPSSVTFVVGEP